jgi:D-sedoheptulose 7-phosphate isomerase
MASTPQRYFDQLGRHLREALATGAGGAPIALDEAISATIRTIKASVAAGNKIVFVGNGGSAGIASHAAVDYTKNGGLRALAFNDASYLTCFANDFGYEHVFAKPIEAHGKPGDVLYAISSSGRSANILNASAAARSVGMKVVTFSGFTPENPLRGKGDLNFYVDSKEYGFVEIAHLALIHTILDLSLGWGAE